MWDWRQGSEKNAIATHSQLDQYADGNRRFPMGQVIPFTAAPPTYPGRTSLLDAAECALLIAIRWWAAAFRQGGDPMPRMRQDLEIAGARDAAFSVDGLMTVVARTVRQPIAVHCPRCPHLSDDEAHLLHAASLAQAGERDLAERALRTALLSAPGAEFALGPLEGLGELFAEARLLFTRRRSPTEQVSPPGAIEAWSPSIVDRIVH
jgi:hypothetical protein